MIKKIFFIIGALLFTTNLFATEPPLKVRESDNSVSKRPVFEIVVDSTSMNLTTSGTTATISSTGGAPTDADYLVGTANASLSAEIVVGTSPGGQLGGTWASPTIDDLFIVNSVADTMAGNLTINTTDPSLILDESTALDTDYWLGVVADQAGDDDDLFQIGDGTTPGTNPFLTINTSGSVGIGTTNPTAKFYVQGSDSSKYVSFTNGGVFYLIGHEGLLSLVNGFDIGAGGVTSVSDFFHIGGNTISLNSSSAYQSVLSVTPTINQSGSAGYAAIKVNVTESATGTGSKNLMDLQIGSVSKMVVKNDGNVGIGTTGPEEELHIESNNPRIQLSDTSGGSDDWHILNSNGDFYIQDSTDARNDFGIIGNGNVIFNGGGNVGIGTTEPTYNLDITSGGTVRAGTFRADNGVYYFGNSPALSYTDNTFEVAKHSYWNSMALYAGASEKVRIDTSGNVGIGTSGPEGLLEIQGAEATDAKLYLDADDGDDNEDTWIIESEAATNNLTFNNHTTEVATLGSTGNLQIDGDLTISGDDLFMGTNTSGFILVADGTNYNPANPMGSIFPADPNIDGILGWDDSDGAKEWMAIGTGLSYDGTTLTASGGANTALSNLASVAINTSLISDTSETDDLGSSSIQWNDTYTENLLINKASVGTSGVGVISIKKGTTPSSSPTDCGQLYADAGTSFASTWKLLLHMDGTDGSTTFTDEIGKAMTAIGNGQIDTAVKKFGTGSYLGDGTGDGISTPDSADWDFGTNDFTFALWVYHTTDPSDDDCRYIEQGDSTADFWYFILYNGKPWIQGIDTDLPTNFQIYCTAEAITDAATWYHVECCRYGTGANNIYIFVDGVSKSLSFDVALDANESMPILNGLLYIACDEGTTHSMNGQIDELLIVNGATLHESNFTAPTSAYSGMAELKTRDEAGNVTTISPHTISRLPENVISEHDVIVSYYSKNEYIGKEVSIDWVSLINDLEKITGNKYIYINDIDKKPIPDETFEKLPNWYKNKVEKKSHYDIRVREEETENINKRIDEIKEKKDDPEIRSELGKLYMRKNQLFMELDQLKKKGDIK